MRRPDDRRPRGLSMPLLGLAVAASLTLAVCSVWWEGGPQPGERSPDPRYLYQLLPEERLGDYGLRPGDEILSVNGRPIESASTREALLEQLAAGEVVFRVKGRNGEEREVRLPISE